MTISTSGELRLLQMFSKPNTEQCVSEDAELWRGVDTGQCTNEEDTKQCGNEDVEP